MNTIKHNSHIEKIRVHKKWPGNYDFIVYFFSTSDAAVEMKIYDSDQNIYQDVKYISFSSPYKQNKVIFNEIKIPTSSTSLILKFNLYENGNFIHNYIVKDIHTKQQIY